MNKEFIPYEQALALKELGFDEPCLVVWPGIKGQKLGYDGRYFSLVKGYKNSKLSKEVKRYAPGIIDVAAPLYQQAFRWLYHKLNIKDGAMPLNEEAQNTLLKELLDKLSSKHLLA